MNGFNATLLTVLMAFSTSVSHGDWTIPLAGNSFRTQPKPGRNHVDASGLLRLKDFDEAQSVFFRVDRPGNLTMSVKGGSIDGVSKVVARVGKQTWSAELNRDLNRTYLLGEFTVDKPGYVRVDLHCGDSSSVALSGVVISSGTDGMSLDYVKNNRGNMFYWGRRGPSVHFRYHVPQDKQLTYAYSEITVPVGQDPIGSFFMANGFGEGYFGFQVNSSTERRVLFSVWSPFKTDNPSEISAENRVVTLAKGEGVHAQDFGNEGSGGQSYLVYPWKAGATYRFLTEVKPDGAGNTLYTSWFGEKRSDQWQLIASFRRPQTNKHLTGFHCFLENFAPDHGYLQRSANYGNQWVVDVDGKWHPITRVTITGDGTARGRHRLDYAGGTQKNQFFLRNGGFFDTPTPLDQDFQHDAAPEQQPDVDFGSLPRS